MTGFADVPAEPLLFQPNPFKVEIYNSFRNIPRYLFRLHGPTTAGATTLSEVTSPAWALESPSQQQVKQDLFQKDPKDAGRLLFNHLIGYPAHEATCNLMSWTSSLLFAIQYGLYRNKHMNSFSRCSLQDLHILVIDTKGFSAGVFIRDMELIDAIVSEWPPLREIREWRTRRVHRLYFGEYLSQGSLDIQGWCVQTSLQNLIDNGLFVLAPALGESEHWHRWANRVVELRQRFESSDERSVSAKSEMRKAIVVAETCFGLHWTLPMALMLLCLKPRPRGDPTIVQGLLATFTGKPKIEAIEGKLLHRIN